MSRVTLNGVAKEYAAGTTYEEIAKEVQSEYDSPIALVTVNGKMRELFKEVQDDCRIEFNTLSSDVGHKTYVRSAIMLMLKAMYDVTGHESVDKVKVEFAIGPGYYCSVQEGLTVDQALVEKINTRMRELVKEDYPYAKRSLPIYEAMKIFRSQKMEDKCKLFKYRRSSSVNVYKLGDYYDYYYGYMLPSTGYVQYFDVILYDKGLMLILPEKKEPTKIGFFGPYDVLYRSMQQSTEWGKMQDIETVGDLNDYICKHNIEDLILVQEAMQERRIGEIASEIASRPGVKFVMIAGPSSSGKTTFSHRLSVQLRSYGLKPHPIGLDDYYRNREETPRDEHGNFDFECLEALDVAQFNKDMLALLEGQTVELPSFNFKTGKREYKGNFKTLGPEDILVIEGIHGLNEKMSESLPATSKYKIYISALTSLNIDQHNRIPVTDARMLRRIVRDARTRNTPAKATIAMWYSVRRGEEKYIYPFQEQADTTFNSALIYELAVLKQFAEPLLFDIEPGEPEFIEAKRLLKFLGYFLGVSSESLPNNSLVREFVGGGCFGL